MKGLVTEPISDEGLDILCSHAHVDVLEPQELISTIF